MADFSVPNSARWTTGQKQRISVEMDRWKNNVMTAIFTGINRSLEKAHQSAVEDAPVRSVFRKTRVRGGGLRRGQRARTLSFAESNEEEAMRRTFGEASSPTGQRTVGRKAPANLNNPYLRRAATRRGNPNSFAPFLLERGTSKKDVEEARKIFAEQRARGFGKNQRLEEDFERSAPVRGGREIRGGRLTSKRAQASLSARGRAELRSGRANFTDSAGVTTLGGRLRKEIGIARPTLQGTIIKGSVVSPTPYARFQEFGTRHNKATPYMRPAVLKLITSFRPEMVKAINRVSSSRGR